MTDTATPQGLALTEGLGQLLAEWADAACVQFVNRSQGQHTTGTVSKEDLLQLMRAVQAAERERCTRRAADIAAVCATMYSSQAEASACRHVAAELQRGL